MSKFNKDEFNQRIFEKIVQPLVVAVVDSRPDIYSNTLDPFSALFDCMINGITPTEWVVREESRQSQKTLQQKVGDLHELAIGCFEDWDSLPVGNVIDVVSRRNKVIAEIKNKFNTTKGTDKKSIYDNISKLLAGQYQGYTGYYVEILPKNRTSYCESFTPPDNTSHRRRPARQDIKRIDGKSFYHLVSGDPDFVHKLYEHHVPNAFRYALTKLNAGRLPGQRLSVPTGLESDPKFREFIKRAFK